MTEYIILANYGSNPKVPVNHESFPNPKFCYVKDNDKRLFTTNLEEARKRKFNVAQVLEPHEIIFDLDNNTTINQLYEHISDTMGFPNHKLPVSKTVKTRGGWQIWFTTIEKFTQKKVMRWKDASRDCICEILINQTTAVPGNIFNKFEYKIIDKDFIANVPIWFDAFYVKRFKLTSTTQSLRQSDGFHISPFPLAATKDIIICMEDTQAKMQTTKEGGRNEMVFDIARQCMSIGWSERNTFDYINHFMKIYHRDFPEKEIKTCVHSSYTYTLQAPERIISDNIDTLQDCLDFVTPKHIFGSFYPESIIMFAAETGVGKTRLLLHLLLSLDKGIDPIWISEEYERKLNIFSKTKTKFNILFLAETGMIGHSGRIKTHTKYFDNGIYPDDYVRPSHKDSRLMISNVSGQFSERNVQRLKDNIRRNNINLLAIDGLQFIGVGDISDPRMANKLANVLMDISDMGVTIIVMNHLTKGMQTESGQKYGQAILGGQILQAVCTDIINVKDASSSDNMGLSGSYFKRRHTSRGGDMYCTLTSDDNGCVVTHIYETFVANKEDKRSNEYNSVVEMFYGK